MSGACLCVPFLGLGNVQGLLCIWFSQSASFWSDAACLLVSSRGLWSAPRSALRRAEPGQASGIALGRASCLGRHGLACLRA